MNQENGAFYYKFDSEVNKDGSFFKADIKSIFV